MTHIQILLATAEPGPQGEAIAHWLVDTLSALSGVTIELLDLRDWLLPALEHKTGAAGSEGRAVLILLPEQEILAFSARYPAPQANHLLVTYGAASVTGDIATKADGPSIPSTAGPGVERLHLPLPAAALGRNPSRDLLAPYAAKLKHAVLARLAPAARLLH